MDNQKCQRCWTQKALFRCPSCEKHQILCNKCDTYIHSMNKNKFHQRYGLNDNYKNIVINPVSKKINKEVKKIRPKSRKNIRDEILKRNLVPNINKNFDDLNNINTTNENLKNRKILKNVDNDINSFIKYQNKTFQFNNKDINNTNNIFSKSQNNQNLDKNDSDIFVYKYNSSFNNSENSNNNNNNLKNKSAVISQKLNLLNSSKNIQITNNMFNSEQNFPYEISVNNFNYEKNNEDNIPPYESFKIRTQIEELGKNMIGDMTQIISDISNEEKNFKNKSLELELKYNNRMKEIEYNKNSIISDLKNKINDINNDNKNLKQDLINMEKEHISKCQELTNMISTLKNKINNKDEEIYYMKKQLNQEEKIISNNNENEKNNLCYLYEEKINNILNISDENQKKLLNIIKEKERIIQELIDANQNKTYNYNNLINKFQRENEEFKNVTQKSIYLAGNSIHNKFLNELDTTNNYKYQKNYYK